MPASAVAHRYDNMRRAAKVDGTRVGILSTYDVENNAVRVLAATLRAKSHHVTEIYFKDWVSNHLMAPTDAELENLVRICRREGLQVLCISIRASAYYEVSRTLTQVIHDNLEIPVLWGGMHPTLVGQECIEDTDLILQGEGELALLEFADRLAAGDDITESPNMWFHTADGIRRNPLRPLIKNLDDLEYRDYTSHDDKYFIYGNSWTKGDPMHGDPVFQMMGSRGCIYKCSYCYNSTYKKDVYPGQKWFRVRSPDSMIDEIQRAQETWDFKRIRFDDEVFNFQKGWLKEFCAKYPREVGLPFEVFIEPKLVNEERMTMLRDAGLQNVYMGVQSSERVTGHLYDRRVKNQTVADIAELYHRLGIKPHFQLIFDDPVSTTEDKQKLLDMISTFPHPFDLYLFSMTVFPGSELNAKLIENGLISEYDIEGKHMKTFSQHRVNLKYPRPTEDTFYIALTILLSKSFVPRPLVKQLSKSDFLKKHPWPVIQLASASNYVKMGSLAAQMVKNGEMTDTLMRRWLNFDTVITT